jgi:hypothetical protein
MNAEKIFREFAKDLSHAFEWNIPKDYDYEGEIARFEDAFFPHVVKILMKDVSFWDEPRVVFGKNVSEVWNANENVIESIWKHLQTCMFAAFVTGDIKTKIGKVIDVFKGYWGERGGTNAEVDRILNDENSKSNIAELLEFVMESRLAKMVTQLFESIDVSELGLNLENPEELIHLVQNPESPAVQKITQKIKGLLEDKIRKGEFSKEVLERELETIKAKVQELFGNVLNDALGGRRAEVPSAVLMSNSPEARRARMLARLQRKHKEKNSNVEQ